MIILLFISLFALLVFLMIPVAIFKMSRAEPITCPQCEAEFKLIAATGKCPNCKAKLFRHASGRYKLRT